MRLNLLEILDFNAKRIKDLPKAPVVASPKSGPASGLG
jgi:hypothetical protein